MSALLQNLAAPFFPDGIRAKGNAYYRQGKVRIDSHDPLWVKARVRGSQMYEVEVMADDDGDICPVECFCSCPYAAQEGECKHIWATLVAIDEAGLIVPPAHARYLPFYDAEGFRNAETFAPAMMAPEPKSWQKALRTLDVDDSEIPFETRREPKAGREVKLEINIHLHSFMTERLPLRVAISTMLKSGAWGKSKPLRAGDLPEGLTEDEHTLAALLLAEGQRGGYQYYNEIVELNDHAAARLLPRLCARGDLMVHMTGRKWGPLVWEAEAPVTFELSLESDAESSAYRLAGCFVQGERRFEIKGLLAIANRSWLIWPDCIRQLDNKTSARWVDWLRNLKSLTIPADDVEKFVTDLLAREGLPSFRFPEFLRYEELRVAPRPELNIHKTTSLAAARTMGASVHFWYDEVRVSGLKPKAMMTHPEKRQMIYRDVPRELALIETVKSMGAKYQHSYLDDDPYLFLPTNNFAAIVRQLIDQGWSVVAEGKALRRDGAVSLSVSSGIDWFDVRANFDYNGATVTLPDLLAAARKKKEWVRLSDGTIGVLPEEWLRKYAGIAEMGEEIDGGLRFKRNQGFLLDGWLADLPNVQVDEVYRRARDKIAGAKVVAPLPPPVGFKGELRPYQSEGLGWLQVLQELEFGGCLADDMGLGKTIQVLAMLEGRRVLRKKEKLPPSLVVVPRSLMFNWMKEAEKFCPKLRFLDHTGSERGFEENWASRYDVMLTTYGTLRHDIEKLKDIEFDYVILDESQAIKNASALTAKCVRLLKGKHRLAMSGTPVENHLGELWSLFEFLNPGLLGASSLFERATRDTSPEQRSTLARALRPFILRRTKSQVAKDLPDRQEDTLYCELPPPQRKKYDELKEYYRKALLSKIDTDGLGKSKIVVLEALLRLRQAACHPGLIDPGSKELDCAKFDTLLPQLTELMEEGHKALIFSQFTSLLSLLKVRLDALGITYEYLDGKTKNRQERVERFQANPACPLFLISLKAGGVGLNLTAADYVFLLDPWWNPAVEAQAIDRAHRIGQTQKVLAYRLIAKDTVEEKVLALQESKRELANAILSEDNAVLRNLTREDLEFLLG